MEKNIKNGEKKKKQILRPIDEGVKKTFNWWGKSIVFIKTTKIKTWQGVFLLALVAGASLATVFISMMNYYDNLHAAANQATLSLVPANGTNGALTVQKDQTFDVDIVLDAYQNNVVAVKADVQFDPTKFSLSSCSTENSPFGVRGDSRGDCLDDVNNANGPFQIVKKTSGEIIITQASTSNGTGVQNESGKIATLTFTALQATAPSAANITLKYNVGSDQYDDSDVIIYGNTGTDILTDTNDATITVVAPPPPDTTAPVITILGGNPADVVLNATYADAGATALDNVDGDLTSDIQITSNNVDISAVGTYTVTYSVTDAAGNAASASRTVNVISGPAADTTNPVITLTGNSQVSVTVGSAYVDAGATAQDNLDGDVTDSIQTVSTVDTSKVGDYTVTYTVSDKAGNTASATRSVGVVAGEVKNPPVITLTGNSQVSVTVGSAYADAGATAIDDVDGDVTDSIQTVSTVDTSKVGDYTVTYTVSDKAGNTASATRSVSVVADDSNGITTDGEIDVDDDVDISDISKPKIKIGTGGSTTLSASKTAYSKNDKFYFKGKDPDLAGGKVKIYEGGDSKGETTVGADGSWKLTAKPKKDGTYEYRLKYYAASGTEIGKSGKYVVKVDTEDPKFTDLPNLLNKRRGDVLWWKATDNKKVDRYKYYFNGKTVETKKDSFSIPLKTPTGLQYLKVRVYDKAGNTEVRNIIVRVR